jgi:hypothetical protein
MKTFIKIVSLTAALLACGTVHAQQGNTATGTQALAANTTGSDNTATGYQAPHAKTTGGSNTANGEYALHANTTGTFNTATGTQALAANTTGSNNTATGYQALHANTTGTFNTATGYQALNANTIGSWNTANGVGSLNANTTGTTNTATGYQALNANTTGSCNTANGSSALYANTTGTTNTATGYQALHSNTTGYNNTAVGEYALYSNTTGSNNVAIGGDAGRNLTTGSNNIDIYYVGVAGDDSRIRIGAPGIQSQTFVAGIFSTPVAGATVVVNSIGQLGVAPSSQRYKRDIQNMGSASEAILALRPVTFRYGPEIDPAGTPQFGLVAEEVEKISPDLVVCDAQHQVYTVRYEAVNAMLLNEFRKQHDRVEQQARIIAEQKDEIAALAARLDVLEKVAANK